jgi:hypothetical protein
VHRSADQPAFAGWSPWIQLQTLIQYWIFYRYDRWTTETLLGNFTQKHQGDWEYVTVGLDATNRPIFLALSAHCAGEVVLWDNDVPAVSETYSPAKHLLVVVHRRNANPATVSHPIIAVARGSHGNYVDDGGHRPPDFGSCAHVPADAVLALSYASNVRDLTSGAKEGWFAYPRDVVVVPSERGHLGYPFNYPGAWGTGEYITIGHQDQYRDGDAPKSPPLQGPKWDTPVQFFVCGAYWQRPHWADAHCDDESAARRVEEKLRSAFAQVLAGILIGDRGEEILAEDGANPH